MSNMIFDLEFNCIHVCVPFRFRMLSKFIFSQQISIFYSVFMELIMFGVVYRIFMVNTIYVTEHSSFLNVLNEFLNSSINGSFYQREAGVVQRNSSSLDIGHYFLKYSVLEI